MRSTCIVLALLSAAGCSGGGEADREVLLGRPESGVSAKVRVQLDSGNAAFRARDLPAAKLHYERAAKAEPKLAAPWMGLAMVARATGDSVVLRRALDRIEQLSPGSSGTHPVGGTLPPNHPTISPHSQKTSAGPK